MAKKLLLGIFVGVFFVYLSFRGVDLGGVLTGLKSARLWYIAPTGALLVTIQLLRSYRWGIILKPIKSIDQSSLFPVSNVGFLAMVAIPARIGEFARPYLISTKTGVSLSSALGTILVERVFDSLSILILFFVVFLFIPLPPWLIKGGVLLFCIILTLFGLMAVLIFRKKDALDVLTPLLRKFPQRWHAALEGFTRNLIDGFKILPHGRSMCYLALLSITIWAIDAMAMYTLFFAFNLDLPLPAAFVLMVIIIMGIAIPAAPGFVGNWHFFCVLGLGLFGVHKADALTYAIVLHFLSIGIIAILGVASLPFNRFSLSDIKRRFSARQDG